MPSRLRQRQHHGNDLADSIVAQIHRDYASTGLNIKTLSAMLDVRRAMLSARFSEAAGMPPSFI
jgi:hypothetical protein